MFFYWRILIFSWVALLLFMMISPLFLSPEIVSNFIFNRTIGTLFWISTAILYLLPLGYYALTWKRRHKIKSIISVCIAILCPVMGSIYLYFAEVKNNSV